MRRGGTRSGVVRRATRWAHPSRCRRTRSCARDYPGGRSRLPVRCGVDRYPSPATADGRRVVRRRSRTAEPALMPLGVCRTRTAAVRRCPRFLRGDGEGVRGPRTRDCADRCRSWCVGTRADRCHTADGRGATTSVGCARSQSPICRGVRAFSRAPAQQAEWHGHGHGRYWLTRFQGPGELWAQRRGEVGGGQAVSGHLGPLPVVGVAEQGARTPRFNWPTMSGSCPGGDPAEVAGYGPPTLSVTVSSRGSGARTPGRSAGLGTARPVEVLGPSGQEWSRGQGEDGPARDAEEEGGGACGVGGGRGPAAGDGEGSGRRLGGVEPEQGSEPAQVVEE